MSQATTKTLARMPSSPTVRKRIERQRRRADGLVAVTVHVHPDDREAVRITESILREGGELGARIKRCIGIVNDRMPEQRKARLRLPKVTAADARAACANIINLTFGRKS